MAVIFDKTNKCYYIDRKIPKPDGSFYHLCFKNKGDERFKSKKYVKSIEADVIERKRKELFNDKRYVINSLDELFDRFYKSVEAEASYGTLKNYQVRFNKYIVREFKNSTELFFDPNYLESWRTNLSRVEACTKYKNNILLLAKHLINFARKVKLIDSDTKDDCLYNLEFFKATPEELRVESRNNYTSLEEFKATIDATDSKLYSDIFTFLYFGGLRVGEFLGIKVSDITFDDDKKLAIVKIQRQKLNTGIITTRLKTKASYKKIAYTDEIYLQLKEYIRRLNLKDDDFLIPVSRQALKSALTRSFEKAGIKYNTLHGFGRKSINTELYLAGADSKVRTTLLGQDSISINENIYIDKEESFEKGLEYIEKITKKKSNC